MTYIPKGEFERQLREDLIFKNQDSFRKRNRPKGTQWVVLYRNKLDLKNAS